MSFIRLVIDSSTSVIGKARRSRRIFPEKDGSDGLVKVNLGCGLAVSKGWINVDASLNALVASWPRVFHKLFYRLSGANQYYSQEQYCDLLENNLFIHHDLSHSIPLKDNTADYVYSSHFLEHLFKADALRLLKESYRVLKTGGCIRVCVPDLSYAIALYVNGEKRKMLENYFFVDDKDSFLARHKYMYDFELLKNALQEAGFTSVIQCNYQKGETPNVESLDNRPEETLFVEAKKL